MAKYNIELNYNARINVEVEGDFHNEGEAFDAAREIAENADINEFIITNELESKVLPSEE